MNTDLLNIEYDLTGKGITIGVLSDSFNCLSGTDPWQNRIEVGGRGNRSNINYTQTAIYSL